MTLSPDFSAVYKRKIAIVHDALVVQSGSERFTLFLSDVLPDAPIYTSAYLPEGCFPQFKGRKIITLPLAGTVKTEKQFKGMFPWWYLGFSTLDLRGYDLVISSANYLSKYINPPAGTEHICYLHNPFRFLWKPDVYSINSVPYHSLVVRAIKLFFPLLRRFDVAKTRKIPHVLTNSCNTARQIQKIYGVTPRVIYPPVDVQAYDPAADAAAAAGGAPEDYYLYAGRLISHKRVDLAIAACRRMNRRLVVAGDGLERPALEKAAAGNGGAGTVEFIGRVSEERLKHLYAHCKALIFPSDEDFGLIPVEAQACGRPVIAYGAGGALETVVENETGVFFAEQTVDSLCDALERFERLDFSPARIRQNARRFDVTVFKQNVLEYICQFN